MRSPAKADMPIRPPADIETFRTHKFKWIAIRRAEKQHEHSPRPHLATSDLNRLQYEARGGLDGGVVAEELLPRHRRQPRVGPNPRHLARRVEKRGRSVGDEVHGRLEAGEQKENEIVENLLRARVLRLIRRGEIADKIIARRPSPLREQIVEITAQPSNRFIGRRPFRRWNAEAESLGEIGGARTDERVIRLRQTD